MELHNLTVFCASTPGNDDGWRLATVRFGEELARRGIDLVYGGGNRGLMGVLADTVKSNGRRTIGVLPKAMDRPSVRTKAVESELIIADDMHERKRLMYERGDGFVALPGGIGTVEELAEIFTWRQLGYHHKPVGLLNMRHYWDGFIAFLSHAVSCGFLSKACFDALIVEEDPATLLDRMERQSLSLPDKLES